MTGYFLSKDSYTMNKRVVVSLSFISLLNLTLVSYGDSKISIGVVSVKKTMKSDISKESEAIVQQVQQAQETQLKKMNDDFTKQQKAYESKLKVAGPEALESDLEKLNDMRAKFDLALKSADEKVKRAAAKEMEKLTKMVQDGAKDLIKSQGLDLVVADETGAVLACSDRVDVTDKLIDAVKKNQAVSKNSASVKSASDAAKSTTASATAKAA